MRFLVVALVVTSAAAASATPRFVGWSPSGGFAWFADGAAVQVCRVDKTDVPDGWPEGASVGPGAACGDVPAQLDGAAALDAAKKNVKGSRALAKNPYGLEVKIEDADGKPTVLVMDGPDKKQPLGDAGEASVADVKWRPDGKAVAVTLVNKKDKTGSVIVDAVDKLLVGGRAGHKLAQKLYGDSQKLYKKRDWAGAGRILEDAITADPDWAPARYARAAAEAQGGMGRTAMIDNLQWLKEHADKDKEAKKLLARAKSDKAFDAWIGDPEVRELVGMPKVSSMDVPARLLERDGVWTAQGATCKTPWLTLQFKKGGAARLTVAESCKGKKTSKAVAAVLKQTPAGPFSLELKKAVDGVPQKSTLVLDDTYQQLKLQPDGDGDAVGTFEPGGPRLEDSTL